MTFPLLLGFSPLGGGDLVEESWELTRRLQGEGAYPTDEDSARDQEVHGWAEMHALGRQPLERADGSILPDGADELLRDWEDALDVPNNAARTAAERRVRANAFAGMPRRADPATVEAVLEQVGIEGAVLHRARREWVELEGASPECVLQGVVQITDEQYAVPAIQRGVDVLFKMLPGRALGSWTREGQVNEMVVTSLDPTWGGTVMVGRTALGNESPSTRDHVRSPARYRDYGPLSRVCARDLNTIQEASLFLRDNAKAGSWINDVEAGAALRYFDFSVAAGATAQLDASVDWRDRMVFVAIRYASSTDIRVSGGVWRTLFNSSTLGYEHLYTGTGGTTSYAKQVGSDPLFFQANAATGALEVRNTGGVTYYGGGLVVASGDVRGRGSSPASVRKVFVDGDPAPSASWYNGVRAQVFTARGNGSAVSAFSGAAGTGGAHRVGALPLIERPASGVKTYVLERGCLDWRDRFAVVFFALETPFAGSGFSSAFSSDFGAIDGAGFGAAWPGAGEVAFTSSPGIAVWASMGGGAPVSLTVTGTVRLVARAGDGALCVEIDSTATESAYSLVLMVHATEAVGVDSVPTVVPAPTVVDGNPIYPYELNALQDGALMAQLCEGDRGSTYKVDSMALGPLLEGPEPYMPAEFRVRARTGFVPESYVLRRQRIAGGGVRRVAFYQVAVGADVVVDSTVDWRDRAIFVSGVREPGTNIRPGALNDTSYNSSTDFYGFTYTHAGLRTGPKTSLDHLVSLSGLTSVLYVADETTSSPGALMLRNDDTSTLFVALMVIASPQLGPRSQRRE